LIVTDLPFQGDLIRTQDAGLVIPMADPGAVAGAVARFAANPQAAKAMGANGAAYVRREASWQARATQISSVMTEAMKRHG
jgi:glycosyltransferase involved in cell wall biosynthesis